MNYFNLHTHQRTGAPSIVELVNQYPDAFEPDTPFFSIGIHPWRIQPEKTESWLDFIASKLESPNCGAIGECGLDKRIDFPLKLQQEIFEKQLLLAERYRKPVVLHCVAAFQEIIETKKRLNISVPLIIHGFSKSVQLAQSLIDNGFYLSFGKYLLRNPELREVFLSVPNDRFFLETDTIEEGIAAVYQRAADYKNISLEALQKNVAANFQAVFKE